MTHPGPTRGLRTPNDGEILEDTMTLPRAENLINQLNSLDESVRIEAKAASEIGKSIMETVSAFANEPELDGGYLLFGVVAHPTLFEREYRAEGLDDPEKIQSDFVTQCATTFNIPVRPQVEVQEVNGKAVVVAYIPEAASTDKPVYVKKRGLPQGAFRRLGPTDHSCSEDDLIVLYAGRQTETHDSSVVVDGSMSDIDLLMVDDYRKMREAVNPTAEELSWSNEDLLRSFGCAKFVDGRLKPTVAGVLLFGTAMALRRCFPMMRIDYIRVPGKQWVEDPDHRFDTVEIRKPLFAAIRQAQAAILEDLPKAFSLPDGQLQSTETPVLPLRVIREAVVNAVMHRTYRIHGAIQIIRYGNRLEIRNPGHSLKSEDTLGDPGSETRNPKIAAVLHDVNIAETKGSGVRVMRQLMHENNLAPPTFESTRQPDRFIATFLFHHFLGPEDLAWLSGLCDEKLGTGEMRALVFVREVGAVDNASYREINQTDTLDASSHLRRLRDLGLLEKKGSGSKTYYLPTDHFQASLVGNSHRDTQDSHRVGEDSHRVTGDQPVEVADIPHGLREQIPTRGSKPSRVVIRSVIHQLCAWRELSASEIAKLLSRTRKPLVRDYLTPMVHNGDLEYTIPEMPDHPDQKYRAVGAEDMD